MFHRKNIMKKIRLIFPLLIVSLLWAQSNLSTRYVLDTKNSSIYWKCDKHYGFFKLDSGYVEVHNGRIKEGKFFVNIPSLTAADLDETHYETAKMILENTLKNEFFEVEKYPGAYFQWMETAREGNTYSVTGEMFMHGQTVCLAFPVSVKMQNSGLEIVSDTFQIDRTDWGIYRLSPQRPYPDDEHGWTVPDTVDIQVRLKLVLP